MTNLPDDQLWSLIARVVSGNADEADTSRLNSICNDQVEIREIVTQLKGLWVLNDKSIDESELAFERLSKKLREIPD